MKPAPGNHMQGCLPLCNQLCHRWCRHTVAVPPCDPLLASISCWHPGTLCPVTRPGPGPGHIQPTHCCTHLALCAQEQCRVWLMLPTGRSSHWASSHTGWCGRWWWQAGRSGCSSGRSSSSSSSSSRQHTLCQGHSKRRRNGRRLLPSLTQPAACQQQEQGAGRPQAQQQQWQ